MKSITKSFCFALVVLSCAFCANAQTPVALAAAVKQHNGRPVIFLNGQPTYPVIYALTDVPGGRWSWEELPRYNLQSFCAQGIKLIQVDLAFDHVWKADGRIDLDTARRQLRGVLDACPGAAVIIRFHVNPPKWWQAQHPEENTVYADTTSMPDIGWGLQRLIEDDEENPARTSLASQRWREEAGQKLNEFLQQLQTIPEANALAGIQVAGGVYGEWHYWGFINNEPDMSAPMLRYFRSWLQSKYRTDTALKKAWNNASVSFATATLPTLEERRKTGAGIFRLPATERKTIDYYEAQHEVVAVDILYFCKIIKHAWPRPIITGAFYGYYYAVFGREAAGGHLQVQKVLNSPDIDFLCGPGTYYPNVKDMGDPYRSRSLITSVRLHNKLWLDEMDQQTPLLPLKGTAFATSLQKSIAQTRRNVLFTFANGGGLWFYDFGPSGFNGGPRLNDHGSFGWWDEPSLRNDIGRVKKLMDSAVAAPYSSGADVLLVHSTETFYYTGSNKDQSYMGHWANNWVPLAVFRSGVVHDVVSVDDLDRVDLDKYKVVLFVNTWMLSDAQRKWIAKNVAAKGRHLVWIYAPGYSNGYRLDKRFAEELIGMHLQEQPQTNGTEVVINDSIVNDYRYQIWNNKVNPFLVVNDASAQALGKISNTKDVAAATKKLNGSQSWFFSLPPANPALWSWVFQKAGAHVYNDSGDVFYNGHGLLIVHTANGGQRNISLRSGKNISVMLAPNSTTVFNEQTGEVVLQ